LKKPLASVPASDNNAAPLDGREVVPVGRSNEIPTIFQFMSQHRSLRAAATTGGKRNVLKRFERVALLKSRVQWKDGDRVTGLRKTKPPE
jgi:small basic protein (TIGR04137 family)